MGALTIGCGETLRQGDDLLIVACSSMVSRAMATADLLSQKGVQATVVNAVSCVHWIKP